MWTRGTSRSSRASGPRISFSSRTVSACSSCLGNLVVNALVRSFQGAALVGDVLNFRYQITGNSSTWYPCTADLSPFTGQYWFTGVADPSVTLFFLLPKAQGQPVYSVTFQFIAADLQILDLAPLDELDQFPFQA